MASFCEGVFEIVPMQHCTDADKKLMELIWVDTDTPVESHSQENTIDTVYQEIQHDEKTRFKEPQLILSCSRQCTT